MTSSKFNVTSLKFNSKFNVGKAPKSSQFNSMSNKFGASGAGGCTENSKGTGLPVSSQVCVDKCGKVWGNGDMVKRAARSAARKFFDHSENTLLPTKTGGGSVLQPQKKFKPQFNRSQPQSSIQFNATQLSVAPNTNLGTHFDKGDFLLVTHFHLGLPMEAFNCSRRQRQAPPCDRCGQPLDVYGDHLVSCPKGGAYRRHNAFCSAIEEIATSAGLHVRREVMVEGQLTLP